MTWKVPCGFSLLPVIGHTENGELSGGEGSLCGALADHRVLPQAKTGSH